MILLMDRNYQENIWDNILILMEELFPIICSSDTLLACIDVIYTRLTTETAETVLNGLFIKLVLMFRYKFQVATLNLTYQNTKYYFNI